MNQHVGAGDALREGAGRRLGLALGAAISMRGGGEIGRADGVGVGIAAEQILDTGAISAGRGAENALQTRCALAVDARRAAASGFSSSSSSRAATACTAASISAICAGKRSRNSPEMRQVTSTRGAADRGASAALRRR